MNQIALMPSSYEEKIPVGHLVRVVNKAIEDLNVDNLLKQYAGGGTSSYHPKMMLKILVYGYCKKIYTSAPNRSVHLSGEKKIDLSVHQQIQDRAWL